jgi:hypothetical protein
MSYHIQRDQVKLINDGHIVKMIFPPMPLRWTPSLYEPASKKYDLCLKATNELIVHMLRELDELNKDKMIEISNSFLRLPIAAARLAVPVKYKSMVATFNEEHTIGVKVARNLPIMLIDEDNANVNRRVTTLTTVDKLQRTDIVQVEVAFQLYNVNGQKYGCSLNVERMWIFPRLTEQPLAQPMQKAHPFCA